MNGYTAILVAAPLGLDSCRQFSDLFRVPVCAHYTLAEDGTGSGEAGPGDPDSALASETVSGLRDLVAMAESPDFADENALRRWMRERLTEIDRLLARTKDAIEGDYDAFVEAVDALKDLTDTTAMAVSAFDASQE